MPTLPFRFFQSEPIDANASDDALVKAVGKGNEQAFTLLYQRHKGYVFRVARRFVADDGWALDATQDTFAYLARKLTQPDFKLTAKLTTLLYPVAKHHAMALAQKHQNNKEQTQSNFQPHPSSGHFPNANPEPIAPNDRLDLGNPAQLAAAKDAAKATLQTLIDRGQGHRLPAAHQEVLLLRFVDGLEIADIAAFLKIPPGTVKSRLHHAIKTLRPPPPPEGQAPPP